MLTPIRLTLLAFCTLLAACGPGPSSTNPSTSPSPGASSAASPAPGATASPAASVTPAVEVKVEAETGNKFTGAGRFPQAERRGQRGIVVMMFSGTDAGSSASLALPALKGRYSVKASYLNHPDSPDFKLELGGVSLTLPAGATNNTSGGLSTYDFGEQLLNIEAGGLMKLSVGGNQTGGAGAWVGFDYFTFTPVP